MEHATPSLQTADFFRTPVAKMEPYFNQQSLIIGFTAYDNLSKSMQHLVRLGKTNFLFVCLLLAAASLPAQTTWTGGVNTSWNNAGNWTAGIPDANDDVTIPNVTNDPVIAAGTNALALSVKVNSSGLLTINSGGRLSIDNTGASTSVTNDGTISNSGILQIGETTNGGGTGFSNTGLLNNNATGELKIDRTGIFAYVNTGTTNNFGKITLGSIASVGQTGIVSGGTFNNNVGGEIKGENCSHTPLWNHVNGIFNNNGKITLGSVTDAGQYGIRNWNVFNNNATGEITIERVHDYGIFNTNSLADQAEFYNAGKITIGVVDAPLYGTYNDNIFTNQACGEIRMFAPFFNNAAISMDNYGYWMIHTAEMHRNTGVPLTNNGILHYPIGNPIPNVTNNDILVNDLTGVCGLVSPALTIGAANSFTASTTWYKNAAQTQIAGTYNQVSNTFTATNLSGSGPHTLYFMLSDNVNGCSRQVVLDLTLPNDNIPPTVVCKNVTANLSAGGTASITTVAVFQSGSDNCGTVNQVSVSPNTFTCSNLGANTVTLTVNNGHSNNATCTAVVTVADNATPTVVCKNATVNLSAGGTASVTTAAVFQSGSDNCGTVNQVSVAPNAFTCSDIGTNTVTLTVNDGHGNTKTCTATVTVADNTAPTVVCKNATVNLSAGGTASITTAAVFQSGSDNCGTVNQVSVAPNSFTCSNLGLNTVTLTVNDGNSNNATCTATVTVTDNTAPTVVCKNATVNLSAGGTASITTAAVFQSGADNCGTVNQVSVAPNTFTCSNLGANNVILTVNDGHGNTNTCTATVTITDDNNACAPLPVELVNLTASAEKDVILLNWETASEHNNAGFQIERSENGRDFAKIAFVNGAGTSADKHTYQLKDKEVRAGKIYFYRLQQLDYDGSFQYSDIVQARLSGGKLTLTVFPNPAPTNSIVQVQLELPQASEVVLMLFDAQGSVMRTEHYDLEADVQTLQMQTNDLPANTYFLKATANGESVYQKLIVTQ